jgi:hypothetical protein
VILPPEPLDDEFHLVVVFSNDPSLKQVNPQAKRAQNTTQNNPVKRSKGRINKKKKKTPEDASLAANKTRNGKSQVLQGKKQVGFLAKDV